MIWYKYMFVPCPDFHGRMLKLAKQEASVSADSSNLLGLCSPVGPGYASLEENQLEPPHTSLSHRCNNYKR